ncbi:MAG: beta-ketoacyl-ACP synthase III [Gammaproteobacteria bacterium]
MAKVYSAIAGVGGHLPKRRVSNDALREWVDTSDEWVRSRTGIRHRHLAAPGELASDLALPAAQKALAAAGVGASQLDAIIFATTTPDRIYPASACLLQAALDAAPCAAFDVQAVCSGFLYALTIGDAMIRAQAARRVLVVGAEVFSHIIDWQDRATCVLFGDGAGAAVLVASDKPGIVAAKIAADGKYADKLTVKAHVKDGKLEGDPYTRMDGAAVYRFATEKMTESSREVLRHLSGESPDWFVPHQANSRIIDAVRKRLNIASERTLFSVSDHSNTSAASVPLAMAAGNFQSGDSILLAAAGGGFTWGAALLIW